MDYSQISAKVYDIVINAGFKIAGALVLYFIGRVIISFAVSLVARGLRNRHLDSTLTNYITSIIGVTFNIALIIGILGFFGFETTSFAAILAAAGVAIGAAWAGLLSNFAAGIFIIVLRPYKVGDFVQAGGTIGTIREIGLFVTALDTPDNVRTFVGNAKLFGDNIVNYSTNSARRVELKAQLNHAVDPVAVIATLKERLAQIPNVVTTPAPEVDILEFNLAGCVLAVRPYTHTDTYWPVYFATNLAIAEVCGKFPVPEQRLVIRNA